MRPDPANEVNPTLAYLMTDIGGSTDLWQRFPKEMARAIRRLDEVFEAVFRACGGELIRERGEGDSHFGVFRRAGDAIRAAIQGQLATLSDPELAILKVRMAVHLGSAEQWAGDHYGTVINRCARIRQVTWPGQILVSEAVHAIVAGEGFEFEYRGEHLLKDLMQPDRLYQVVHSGLPHDFDPPETLSTLSHNLPAYFTSFVGREREMEELGKALDENRLLTLTGPGGIGKTRLTQQLAAELIRSFKDGVWFVNLAQTERSESVVPILCGVLAPQGGKTEEALLEAIGTCEMLVILDNCEHLFGECRRLASRLLKGCPGLKMLATSRRVLDVQGEFVYRLDGLPLPSAGDLHDPMRFAGFALFVERARRRGTHLLLDAPTVVAIVELCEKLDGLPLAIEMAAVMTDVMGIGEIAESISDYIGLGPEVEDDPRQRTMAATVAWSRNLLSAEGRHLLDLVSIFPNTWSFDAAAEVCLPTQPKTSTREILRELLNHSLVFSIQTSGGGKRFGLLQTTRQVVLAGSPRHEEIVPSFVRFFERLVDSTRTVAGGGEEGKAHKLLSLEWESIAQALEYAHAIDPDRSARMALALRAYFLSGTRLSEAKRWFRQIARSDGLAPFLRVSALVALSSVCILRGENDEALASLTEAEETARPMGGCEWARVIGNLAVHQDRMGRYREAKEGFEACYELFVECGAWREQALSLLNIGVAKLRLDEPPEECAELYRRALRVAEERDYVWLQAKAWSCLAHLDVRAKNWTEALRANLRALRLWQQDMVLPDCALAMLDLAEAFSGRERFDLSASAVHLADRFEELSGSPFPSVNRDRLETSRGVAKSRTSPGHWWAGHRLMKAKTAAELTEMAIHLIEAA